MYDATFIMSCDGGSRGFFHEKKILGDGEEIFSTRHKGVWRKYTHKNKHEMESISPHLYLNKTS